MCPCALPGVCQNTPLPAGLSSSWAVPRGRGTLLPRGCCIWSCGSGMTSLCGGKKSWLIFPGSFRQGQRHIHSLSWADFNKISITQISTWSVLCSWGDCQRWPHPRSVVVPLEPWAGVASVCVLLCGRAHRGDTAAGLWEEGLCPLSTTALWKTARIPLPPAILHWLEDFFIPYIYSPILAHSLLSLHFLFLPPHSDF